MIPVSAIDGTSSSSVTIKEHRLRKMLNWLLRGEFQKRPERPPKLEKFCEKYYVSVDGHHRVIAFKWIGIDEIFAEYVGVELPE